MYKTLIFVLEAAHDERSLCALDLNTLHWRTLHDLSTLQAISQRESSESHADAWGAYGAEYIACEKWQRRQEMQRERERERVG